MKYPSHLTLAQIKRLSRARHGTTVARWLMRNGIESVDWWGVKMYPTEKVTRALDRDPIVLDQEKLSRPGILE